MGQPVVTKAGRLTVDELLKFLATHCSFLVTNPQYKIVDSSTSDSFGNALLVMESGTLRLRFTRDRGRLLMEFQAMDGRPSEWFSPGLLRGLITGDRGGSEVLNPGWAEFLESALPELESRVSDPSSRDTTLMQLRSQAQQRAHDLFG